MNNIKACRTDTFIWFCKLFTSFSYICQLMVADVTNFLNANLLAVSNNSDIMKKYLAVFY